jgi:hypothetical protein
MSLGAYLRWEFDFLAVLKFHYRLDDRIISK